MVLKEIRKKRPHLQICGVGGNEMSPYLDNILFRTEELSVMGFVDVLLIFPRILKRFFFLRKQLLTLNPKVLVFIDYAEFNLLMERSLRKQGYKGKIIHYISPSVWAWRKKRTETLAKNVDHLLTIFPFEKSCYTHTSLPVTYVGNPLVNAFSEITRDSFSRQEQSCGKMGSLHIGLFPGSRRKEIEKNLPFLLKTATSLLEKEKNVHFTLSIASDVMGDLINDYLQKLPQEIRKTISLIPPTQEKGYFSTLDLAIATSGTITLELALYQVPTIVIFAIGFLDLIILRDILSIRLPHYCIVNIIAGKEIFCELYGPNLTQQRLESTVFSFVKNPHKRDALVGECKKVKEILGNRHAPEEACEVICSYL